MASVRRRDDGPSVARRECTPCRQRVLAPREAPRGGGKKIGRTQPRVDPGAGPSEVRRSDDLVPVFDARGVEVRLEARHRAPLQSITRSRRRDEQAPFQRQRADRAVFSGIRGLCPAAAAPARQVVQADPGVALGPGPPAPACGREHGRARWPRSRPRGGPRVRATSRVRCPRRAPLAELRAPAWHGPCKRFLAPRRLASRNPRSVT